MIHVVLPQTTREAFAVLSPTPEISKVFAPLHYCPVLLITICIFTLDLTFNLMFQLLHLIKALRQTTETIMELSINCTFLFQYTQ